MGVVEIANVPPSADGENIHLFGRVSHSRTKMIIEMNMINIQGEFKQFVKTDFTDGLGEYDKSIAQTVNSIEELLFDGATLSFELNSIYTTGTVAKKEIQHPFLFNYFKNIWEQIVDIWGVNAATTTTTTTIKIKPIPSYIKQVA